MRRNYNAHSAQERGQAIVLAALLLPVLLGFVGFSVDFGRLAVEQRKLQNLADSAALAGAQDLSLYYTQACGDATTSLTQNSNPGTSTCTISNTNGANDTITVTVTEPVSLDFMPLLGLNTKTLTAHGTALTSTVTGCNDNGTGICIPYASWRPAATSGCPDQYQPGMTIVFRDNQWRDPTGASACNDWQTNSDNFKGFLRPSGTDIYIGNSTLTTKGGNACGQEPVSLVQSAYNNHTKLVIPVFDSSSGNGSNINVHIPGFITIILNFTYQYPNQVQSVTLNGPPTGGTFTLTYSGKTTTPLAYNASESTVQSALAALSTVGANNVAVTGVDGGISTTGGPYIITFGGTLDLTSLQPLTTTSVLSGGTSPAISVAQTETNSSRAGQNSAVGDYTCPATWYGMVVQSDTGVGTVGGINGTTPCTSTFYSCQIRLQP